MIGEEMKNELCEITIEELRIVTWDYSKEDIVGLYNGKIVRGFMWDVKECGDINPQAVTRCNVSEGWIEYFEAEVPKGSNILTTLKKVKRDQDGNPIKTKVDCKAVVNLFTAKGDVIITLS